jgi:hypothetical protein
VTLVQRSCRFRRPNRRWRVVPARVRCRLTRRGGEGQRHEPDRQELNRAYCWLSVYLTSSRVRWATGGKGVNHADWPRRIGLRMRHARDHRQRGSARGQMQKSAIEALGLRHPLNRGHRNLTLVSRDIRSLPRPRFRPLASARRSLDEGRGGTDQVADTIDLQPKSDCPSGRLASLQ